MPEQIPLPTREDLVKLTLRAVVAYAARCARRLQPLFDARAVDLGFEKVAAVERAIAIAETFANSTGTLDADAAEVAHHMAAYTRPAEVATVADVNAYAAAYAAAVAASHAAKVAIAAAAGDADAAVDIADAAAQMSWHAGIAVGCGRLVLHACMNDYQHLLKLSDRTGGTMGDPIDLEHLGPHWSEGGPPWCAV